MLSGMTTALDANPVDTAERGSAYPPDTAQILSEASELARELGKVPSRNELMRRFRIGAPKANALRDILIHDELWKDRPKPTPKPALVDEPTARDSETDEPTARTAEDLHPADGHPGTPPAVEQLVDEPPTRQPLSVWPLILIAIPAAVSIWAGWVGLGGLTGFGVVHPLPGILPDVSINTAITLPIGVEAYAAFALRAWLGGGRVPARARRFARTSAIGSLLLGALGQVAYHLLAAGGVTTAPWWITTVVACLPVAVLGMGAALAHLLRDGQ
jgi:hypothetical protein